MPKKMWGHNDPPGRSELVQNLAIFFVPAWWEWVFTWKDKVTQETHEGAILEQKMIFEGHNFLNARRLRGALHIQCTSTALANAVGNAVGKIG